MTEPADWSFSPQWKTFYDKDVKRTWSWTIEQRSAMFLREVDLTPEDLSTMTVLDAGSGNGHLTEAMGAYAADVVGLDRSEGAVLAENRRTRDNVSFKQGDLNNPPFPPESFDLVYSSGVIHHNPNTEDSFHALAKLVKPGGYFYCFVYRWAAHPIPVITLLINEPIRWVVSRLPRLARDLFVRGHAGIYHAILSVIRPGKYTYNEHLIAAYDATTPRWAHRHTPFEMAKWFHDAGFDSAKLTHWDNGGGFGMVARKVDKGPPAGYGFLTGLRRR